MLPMESVSRVFFPINTTKPKYGFAVFIHRKIATVGAMHLVASMHYFSRLNTTNEVWGYCKCLTRFVAWNLDTDSEESLPTKVGIGQNNKI